MIRVLLLFVSLTILFRLNAQTIAFEAVLPPSESKNISLMGIDVGESAIADIDNDNDLDIIMVGDNNNGHHTTNLYKNDGNGNFSIVLNTPFDGARSGSVEFADVDNDADMDVLIAGQHSDYTFYTKLYKNDGKGNFTVVANTPFAAIIYGSITFADVDGDKDQDLFLTGNNITKLYLNNGQGNFTESSNVFQGTTYCDADMADIDGDSDVDIVLTGQNIQNRRITKLYKNNGTGVFSEVVSSATTFEQVYFSSVSFGDADGDKDNDILLIGTNALEQRVTKLYLNNGSGTFTLDTNNTFIGASSGTVFFADLDNDGDNDIYLAGMINSLGDKIAKIYTNSGGRFSEITTATFDLVTTGSAEAKDIDGDNDLDIITTGSTERISSKYVNEFRSSNIFLNQGNMNFDRVHGCSIKDFESSDFDYSDIDSDNDLDIVIVGESEDGLSTIVYKNDGNGNYSEQADNTIPGSFFYGSVELADVDGDSDPDLLITGIDTDDLLLTKLYLNNGNGEFEVVTDTPFVGLEASTSSFFDIDQDGDQDLLLTGDTNIYASEARLYKNDGKGTFTEEINIPFEGVREGSVAITDVDGDKDLDVVIAGSKCVRTSEYEMSCYAGINLYTNDGKGNFTKSSHYPLPVVSSCEIAFGDVDNDGDRDLLLTGEGIGFKKYASIFKNNGSGYFTENTSVSIPGVDEGSVSFGNLDGDGYIDILVAGYTVDYKEITSLFKNDKHGGFSKVASVTLDGLSNGRVAFMDIDNDGDDDVLTSGSGFTKLYRNITGDLVPTDIDASQNQYKNSADIILLPNPTKGDVAIYLNNNEHATIQVFNSFGTLCFEAKDVNTSKYNLEINGTPGIYIVKISSQQIEKRIKVIKQ